MSRTPQRRLGNSGLSSSVLVPSNRPQPELQVILLPETSGQSSDADFPQFFTRYSLWVLPYSAYPSCWTNSEICCHYRPDCPVPKDYHSPSYPDKSTTDVRVPNPSTLVRCALRQDLYTDNQSWWRFKPSENFRNQYKNTVEVSQPSWQHGSAISVSLHGLHSCLPRVKLR